MKKATTKPKRVRNEDNMPRRSAKISKTDSKKDLKFVVIQDDIVRASCKEPLHCVVARAIPRQNSDVESVWVNRSTAVVKTKAGKYLRYTVPSGLQAQINAFDITGRSFTPGQYKLAAPSPSHTLKAYDKRTQQRRDTADKNVVGRHLKTKGKIKRPGLNKTRIAVTGVRTVRCPW